MVLWSQGGGLNADMSNKSSGTSPIQNEANNGLANDRGTIAHGKNYGSAFCNQSIFY